MGGAFFVFMKELIINHIIIRLSIDTIVFVARTQQNLTQKFKQSFLRGKPQLCRQMQRPAKTSRPSSRIVPDFYELSRIDPLPEPPQVVNRGSALKSIHDLTGIQGLLAETEHERATFTSQIMLQNLHTLGARLSHIQDRLRLIPHCAPNIHFPGNSVHSFQRNMRRQAEFASLRKLPLLIEEYSNNIRMNMHREFLFSSNNSLKHTLLRSVEDTL